MGSGGDEKRAWVDSGGVWSICQEAGRWASNGGAVSTAMRAAAAAAARWGVAGGAMVGEKEIACGRCGVVRGVVVLEKRLHVDGG